MKDHIRVEGIEFHGFHGLLPEERVLGHRFRVDLELELDLAAAGRADDLELTVDYAAAAQVVLDVANGERVRLVETLAERIAGRLLNDFKLLDAVIVRVAKLHPPVPLLFAASAVEIRRSRH